MTCTIPANLPWLSEWALAQWTAGKLTDIGFYYYFTRMSSDLLGLAECLVNTVVA